MSGVLGSWFGNPTVVQMFFMMIGTGALTYEKNHRLHRPFLPHPENGQRTSVGLHQRDPRWRFPDVRLHGMFHSDLPVLAGYVRHFLMNWATKRPTNTRN